MLISVIVPVYQIGRYIERCLQSLLKQQIELEIVTMDDGSSDGSGEQLDEFAFQNQNGVAIHKLNEGVTIARLTGVQFASGEYIGFCDGDDIVESEMYYRLYHNLIQYNADISHCGHKVVYPNGKEEYYYNTGRLVKQDRAEGLKDLLDGSFEPGLCSKLFRKNLLHTLLHSGKMATNIRIFEDLLMNYYLFGYAEITVYEDFCPYIYMKREGSASKGLLNRERFWDPVKVKKVILQNEKGNELEKTAGASLLDMYFHLYNNLIICNNKNVEDEKECIRKEIRDHAEYIPYYSNRKYQMLITLICKAPLIYQLIYFVYQRNQKNQYEEKNRD